MSGNVSPTNSRDLVAVEFFDFFEKPSFSLPFWVVLAFSTHHADCLILVLKARCTTPVHAKKTMVFFRLFTDPFHLEVPGLCTDDVILGEIEKKQRDFKSLTQTGRVGLD